MTERPGTMPQLTQQVRPHRRFNVDDYYALADAGILHEDSRVELLDGEILPMCPTGSRHASIIDSLNQLFMAHRAPDTSLRVQCPLRLDEYSEPEPDFYVVHAREDGYWDRHPEPADVLLVVEVADSSLARDRRKKLPLYAAAGIPEVWIVNVGGREIEVFREPEGERYTHRSRFGADDVVSSPALRGDGVDFGKVFRG